MIDTLHNNTLQKLTKLVYSFWHSKNPDASFILLVDDWLVMCNIIYYTLNIEAWHRSTKRGFEEETEIVSGSWNFSDFFQMESLTHGTLDGNKY